MQHLCMSCVTDIIAMCPVNVMMRSALPPARRMLTIPNTPAPTDAMATVRRQIVVCEMHLTMHAYWTARVPLILTRGARVVTEVLSAHRPLMAYQCLLISST